MAMARFETKGTSVTRAECPFILCRHDKSQSLTLFYLFPDTGYHGFPCKVICISETASRNLVTAMAIRRGRL